MTLARHQITVQDLYGNVVPGVHVEVRAEVPGQPLATLYSDRDGLVGIGNPFDADSEGIAYFHVLGGAYKIRVYTGTSGAPTTEHIQRYVAIGLNSEFDTITTDNFATDVIDTDVSLAANSDQRLPTQKAIKTYVDDSFDDISYTQPDTGAVSSPLITRFSNTLFAHEFGAVGNDSTNDATALQAFITAAVTSGKEARLDPGKKYYVSGADLTIAVPSLSKNFCLYGNGSQIRTNAAEARTAIKVQHVTAAVRADEVRKVLISGVTINQFDNANAAWGINVIGSPHVTIEGCSFLAGSDTGVANQANYGCIRFGQSNALNPDTGSFWGRASNNDFKGGTTKLPHCMFFQGGSNAVVMESNTFASATIAVRLGVPSAGLNANEAVIANGIRILNNDFEGLDYGVYVVGTASWSKLEGLICSNNRIESIGTVFFNHLLNTAAFAPPIIGPNYLDSGSWGKYISNLNALAIDVRDQYVGHATIDPANLAAGATAIIGTITIAPSAAGDQVVIEATNDLQGLIVTGSISGANTVSIRLTNPTSGAVNLGSVKFVARVRPQY